MRFVICDFKSEMREIMIPNETTTLSELDWLAFCYVARELSADESKTFEERLATEEPDDTRARELADLAVAFARIGS